MRVSLSLHEHPELLCAASTALAPAVPFMALPPFAVGLPFPPVVVRTEAPVPAETRAMLDVPP